MCAKRKGKRELQFTLDVIIEPDEDEFHAFCPTLKGLHTSGRTKEEALKNATDAAIAYLTSLLQHGHPIPIGCVVSVRPEESPPTIAPINVQFAVPALA